MFCLDVVDVFLWGYVVSHECERSILLQRIVSNMSVLLMFNCSI
jgi:hypothetical protein